MKQKPQITLTDIAKKLNISKVAVSKALRDHSDISIKTKTRVKKMAVELGYVPNYIARNLSAKKSNTIGLVVPKIAHHFFAEAIEAIYETAYQNNYEIIMTVSQENTEHEQKHIETLLAMRVDGLLVSTTEQTDDSFVFEKVRQQGVPMVFFDRVINGIGFNCITTEDRKGSYKALKYLIKSGYTKIAHLAGYQSTNIGLNRAIGFKDAMKESGLSVKSNWFIEGGIAEIDGYEGFKRMYETGSLPEVVFTVTFPVALGVLQAAKEKKLSIPGDLDLLCFGGSGYNSFLQPSISYIKQPIREIGSTATNLVIEQIQSPKESVRRNIKLPTELVICDTCKEKD
ncbi:MAG: LacI family transcriptional regulator [Calditrichaeota bacterium]|nr:MAG: LacI family transcriptional regulator [Calditrichota bacterium]MBL1204743.1 LacI family transcriptional regulator [Calditrichota bacterium]NOG44571.1 LacI family DNA-binding transcriptional regulator [Calditrichota bacterium]